MAGEDYKGLRPETLAILSGNLTSIVPPIDTAKTEIWESLIFPPGHTYSRSRPDSTCLALERKISVMHGGAEAIATGSGQGALIDILETVGKGDHIIAGKQLYGGTIEFLRRYFSKGRDFTLVDPNDINQLENAIRDNTKYLLIETPTNPLLDVIDLEQVQRFSEKTGVPYILDNTFATNQLLDGFQFGAHIIFYSASKYLGGHHNAIAGVAVTKDKKLADEIRDNRRWLGHFIPPHSSYFVHMGLETLSIRMKEHCKNAQAIAEYLDGHSAVSQVFYPGLKSHPGHEIARQQMSGFGGVVSFKVKDNPTAFAEAVIDQKQPKVVLFSESLGSARTLLAYPIKMSHRDMPHEERQERGIDENLFRLSVGRENVEDIKRSLEEALQKV